VSLKRLGYCVMGKFWHAAGDRRHEAHAHARSGVRKLPGLVLWITKYEYTYGKYRAVYLERGIMAESR